MVFTNLITTTHVNMTTNRPLMSSMATGGCKSANIMHSRRGCWEPIVVIAPIFYHKDGHYVRLNRVALKYPNFKKDVDLDVHVRMFNLVVKANAKTSKSILSMLLVICLEIRHRTGAIITCQNFLTIFFWSLHKHFANVIEKLRMTSKYIWSWKTWSNRRLKGWRFTTSIFKSWLMVYKYQP